MILCLLYMMIPFCSIMTSHDTGGATPQLQAPQQYSPEDDLLCGSRFEAYVRAAWTPQA